jgi:hypothetical protein
MFHTYVVRVYYKCFTCFSHMLQQVFLCCKCSIHVLSVYTWIGGPESAACIRKWGCERMGQAREADADASSLHVHARERRRRERAVLTCMRARETEQARVVLEDTRGRVQRGHATSTTSRRAHPFGHPDTWIHLDPSLSLKQRELKLACEKEKQCGWGVWYHGL